MARNQTTTETSDEVCSLLDRALHNGRVLHESNVGRNEVEQAGLDFATRYGLLVKELEWYTLTHAGFAAAAMLQHQRVKVLAGQTL